MGTVKWFAVLSLGIALGMTACSLWQRQEPVGGYVGGYVGDSAITARVRQALVKDPAVEATEIDVHTYEGKVTLAGVVDDDAMARRAVRVTQQTPGVRSVENSLQVAASPTELTAR
jgi:osmotically-inducible protein OsmY